MLTLNSGRFALIERSHDFALVPWRPVLERARGQLVTGSMGGQYGRGGHIQVDRHQARHRTSGGWGRREPAHFFGEAVRAKLSRFHATR